MESAEVAEPIAQRKEQIMSMSIGSCEVLKESDGAWLVNLPDVDVEEEWIPKSQIDEDMTGEMSEGETVEELYVSTWLAKKLGA